MSRVVLASALTCCLLALTPTAPLAAQEMQMVPSPPIDPVELPLRRDDPRAQLEPEYLDSRPIEMPMYDPRTSLRPDGGGRVVGYDMATGQVTYGDPPARRATEPATETTRVAPASYGRLPLEGVVFESTERTVGDDAARVEPDLIDTTNTTAWPQRATVKLYPRFPWHGGGTPGNCSGTLISRRHVLTAGHCVYDKNYDQWASAIRVIPGLDGTYMPFGDAWAAGIRSVTGWTVYEDSDYDWALITLDRNVGDATGWTGYVSYSNDDLGGKLVRHDGYSVEGYSGTQQAYSTGNVHSYDSTMVYTNLENHLGFSGTGTRRITLYPDAPFMITTARNCYFWETVTTYPHCGTRINNDRFYQLGGWIAADAGAPVVGGNYLHWYSLNGLTFHPPTAVARADTWDRIELLALGTNSHVYYKRWTPNGWSGWDSFGGPFLDSPEAVARQPHHFDVFARGVDKQIYLKTCNAPCTSSANLWPTGDYWHGLGTTKAQAAPAAASWDSDRLDVFIADTNGDLRHRPWTSSGGWPTSNAWAYILPSTSYTSYNPASFDATGAPSAVGRKSVVCNPVTYFCVTSRRADVAVHGADGFVWHAYSTGGAFSFLKRIPGKTFGPGVRPAIVSPSNGRVDVFIRDTNFDSWPVLFAGPIWHAAYYDGYWHGWENLGGVIIGDVTAVVRNNGNVINLFVRGANGAVYTQAYYVANNTWSNWANLGNDVIGTPAACSRGPGNLDVFARSTDNWIRGRAWTQAGGWVQ